MLEEKTLIHAYTLDNPMENEICVAEAVEKPTDNEICVAKAVVLACEPLTM